jgi:phosphoglycerate dehydrogenase-like enzyme
MQSLFLDYATVDPGRELDLSRLMATLPGLRVYAHTADDDLDLRLHDAEVVLLNRVLMTRARITAASRLRLIGLTATGTNNVDLAAARERGVAVCNISEYCTQSVVQHVFAEGRGLGAQFDRGAAAVPDPRARRPRALHSRLRSARPRRRARRRDPWHARRGREPPWRRAPAGQVRPR